MSDTSSESPDSAQEHQRNPAAATQAGPGKRRWAPRGRTGCLHCRVRRVRCDETKPTCKSCKKRRIVCRYELSVPSDASSPETVTSQSSNDSIAMSSSLQWYRDLVTRLAADEQAGQPVAARADAKQKEQDRKLAKAIFATVGPWVAEYSNQDKIPIWLVPHGWEAVEAVYFVNSVVRRDQIEEATAETKHLAMLSTQPYDEQNDILTASILTTRICSVGMVTNTENKPAQPFLHLWIRVRQLLSSSIQTLSMQLRRVDVMTDDELAGVLKRIRRMIVVEEYLALGGAFTHLRGGLALLNHIGVPLKLARENVQAGNAIQNLIVGGVISNTLMRYDANIFEVATLNEKDVMGAFNLTYFYTFQSPSRLFKCVLEVAKLRGKAAAGQTSAATLSEEARTLFNEIQSFQPHNWEESYPIPEKKLAIAMASTFKAAIALYCCLCIPSSRITKEFAEWRHSYKVKRRNQMIQLCSNALEMNPRDPTDVLWPIAVAGFAIKDGSVAQKALLDKLLADMGWQHGRMPVRVRRGLQKVWLQTKEDWDDCWHDPLFWFI